MFLIYWFTFCIEIFFQGFNISINRNLALCYLQCVQWPSNLRKISQL